MSAMSWLIYGILSSVTVIMMATSSFGCSDKPCLSASRQRYLLMGNSHGFYQGTAPGLSLDGYIYHNTTARTSTTCAVVCLLDDACKSFNYCMDGKLCQLNSAVYSENNDTLMESSGCLYFDESFREALPCQVYETKPKTVKFEKDMVMPVRLELSVVSSEVVDIDFEAGGRKFEVELHPKHSEIKEELVNGKGKKGNQNSDTTLLATRVVIDFNSTHITVGQKGIPESQFSLTYNTNTATNSIVQIESDDDATWTIYYPCKERFA